MSDFVKSTRFEDSELGLFVGETIENLGGIVKGGLYFVKDE